MVVGVLLAAAAGAARAQESGIVPVATVRQLCEGMITASSDALFNVGREAPDDDDDWRAVLHNALMLAEAGNLLMLDGRARDDGEWMTMSRALVDAGITAVRAVEVRDVDALLGAGRRDRGGVRDVPRALPRRGPVDAGPVMRPASPHCSPGFVARPSRRRCGGSHGLSDAAGVVVTTSKRREGVRPATASGSAAAAEGW